MQPWKFVRTNIGAYFKRWGSYIVLTSGTSLFISLIMIPIFNAMTQFVLKNSQVDYVSYTNLLNILTQHPFTVLLLFLILVLILLTVYSQFAFLLFGIEHIRHGQPLRLGKLLQQTFRSWGRLRPKMIGILMGYFIIILPFGHFVFNSQLLSKVTIPDFINEYIDEHLPLLILLIVLSVLIIWVAVRLLAFIPAIIMGNKSPNTTLKASWNASRGQFWRILWANALIAIVGGALTVVGMVSIYLIQKYIDTSFPHVALGFAIGNLTLLQIYQEFVLSFNTVMVLRLAIKLAEQADLLPQYDTPLVSDRKHKIIMRLAAVVLMILGGSVVSIVNFVYLEGLVTSNPLTISHRGVDDGNGVQNTIPALEKTSKENPDYVEMDIHETKDNQFVVMHDENLEALAGVNKRPHDLTLKQLTKLTVKENGHQAKIASFDDYLKTAQGLNQKLLIEIKTTPMDSKGMLNRFIKKYQASILKHKDRIHSLDYHVVQGLKQKAPKLYVSYILPYNLTFPDTKANAYTMEATTLNGDFVSKAHDNKQDVFAWTVNDDTTMQKMMFADVDGIITDNLSELKETIKETNDKPSYADQILNFTVNLNTSFNTPEN